MPEMRTPTKVGIIVLLSATCFGASKHCDRPCMIALTDQYLAALVKHDPSGLPLSRESDSPRTPARATFKIFAVDPASNQVGFYGVMKENDRPLIIALRLKVIDGEITRFAEDCERHENGGQTTHNATPFPWPVTILRPSSAR